MNTRIFLRTALAMALLGAAGAASAQDSQWKDNNQSSPSVDSIIDSLKTEPVQQGPGQTRALRPGAAAAATAAPPPPVAKPKPASINMQINFEFNSAEIDGSSSRTMANLAKALGSQQLANRSFTIVGHTDGKGSAAYNKALSDRRAAAVRAYLIDNGVQASRLRAVGRGESQLLNKADPNASENRRVEIQATGG